MKRSAVNFLTRRNLYAKYHPANKKKQSRMKRSVVNFLTGKNLYAKYHPANKK